MMYFRNDSIQYIVNTISSDIVNGIENGTHVLKDKRGEEIMSGARISGLKTGLWHYHTNDSLTWKIDWEIYEKGDSIQINIPVTWSVLKTKHFFFQPFQRRVKKER